VVAEEEAEEAVVEHLLPQEHQSLELQELLEQQEQQPLQELLLLRL